jgi:hypothetical protein
MKTVLISRLESTDSGTFGLLTCEGLTLYTGELPWRDNSPDVSCIPIGEYEARISYSPHFNKNLYHVLVPGRVAIEIHAANFCGDASLGLKCQLHGCIALGLNLGEFDGQKALVSSRAALDRFHAVMAGEPLTVKIS